MSSAPRLAQRRCMCNYKCRHTPTGMQLVSGRTYYEHCRQDAIGNIHPTVRRNVVEVARSTGIASSSTESTRHVVGTPGEARRIWCNCASYCAGGRMVPPSTFTRHQSLQKKYNDLVSRLGCSPPEDEQDNISLDQNDAYTPLHDEVEFQTLGSPTDDVDYEELTLEEQIIARCIEMQTLWDQFQTPIKFQDEMLRILFGDMAGTRVGKKNNSKKKPSLAKLLVRLPSTWDGDLGGVRVPACWKQLNNIYSGLGMTQVQRFKICAGSKDSPHEPEVLEPSKEDNYTKNVLFCICREDAQRMKILKRDCLSCCEKCARCNLPRKNLIAFDYAPIGPQLCMLTKSRTLCHELLRMWRNKERWLGKYSNEHPEHIFEFWDGEKCRATQTFWDPNSFYELPIICEKPHCKKAYATFPDKSQILQDGWNEEERVYDFVCTNCRSSVRCEKKLCKGDPRNFALLLHWDGFQASRTTQHDSGVVEIAILNAGKSTILDIFPVLFIPFSCKKQMQNSPEVFGAFMKPLVAELESLFVNGIELYYNYPLKYLSSHVSTISKNCHLRAMLMTVTGDHPAQCKMGLFKDGGQAFCRRDKAQATLEGGDGNHPGRYIYDGNRYQARYPPPKRSIHEMVGALTQSKKAGTQVEREEILRGAGLSGESVLWRLHDIYNFNVSTDLVYDVMHILSLNLFRKFISILMKGSTNETKRDIDAIVVEVSKTVPRSIRYGRWPHVPSKYHGGFKAEENQKFIQWCLPHVLGSVANIPSHLHDLGLLLIDIAHFFYNYSRDNGCSYKDMEVVRHLLLAWRVRSEESIGKNSSPLEHVAGNGEILDDIYRHGMHDVFWCYAFERKVSCYVSISTNNRSNEISYAQYYRRRLFTSVFEHMQRDKDGLMPFERLLKEVHVCLTLPEGYVCEDSHLIECPSWHGHGILEVSSVAKAREIWKLHVSDNNGYPCESLLEEKGIAITRKKKRYRPPTKEEVQYAEHFWNIQRNHGQFLRVTSYPKIFFRGELYELGNEVVVKANEIATVEVGVGHWKARITSFFSIQHDNHLMLFFGAEYYQHQIVIEDGHESLWIDRVTGMSVLYRNRLPFNWNCIRPIKSLLHKFIPLAQGLKLIAYETKDIELRKRLLEPGFSGCVPPFLEVDDIVLVQCCSNASDAFDFRHAVLREVDVESRLLRLAWLTTSQRHRGRWQVEVEEDAWRPWNCCINILSNWTVVGERRVEENGTIKRLPIMWQSIT